MIRRPPRSTRTDTRFPYTTLFRSAEPRGSVGRSGLPSACTPVRGWLSGLHASVQRYDDGQHGRSVNEQDASEPLHRRRLSSCTEKPSSCGLHAEAIESAVLVKPYTNPLGDEAQRRSEEHTSELQSLMRISYAVLCLKNKKKNK